METNGLTFEQLELILRFNQDKTVRELAIIKVIDKYSNDGNYRGLIHIANDRGLSEDVRELAKDRSLAKITETIDKMVIKGYYTNLLHISIDEELPEYMRKRAGTKAIDICVNNGKYDELENIMDHGNYNFTYGHYDKVPEYVRELARDKLVDYSKELAGKLNETPQELGKTSQELGKTSQENTYQKDTSQEDIPSLILAGAIAFGIYISLNL